MKQRMTQILATVVWMVPASAAALLALAYVPTVFGYESLIVAGGSMGGEMPAGSVALTQLVDSRAVGEGDVVSYRLEGASQPTTHRVIDVREKDGHRLFITKGDANPRPDPNPVVPGTEIHVVQRVVPLAGHIVTLARSPAGGVLLFLIPMIGLTHQRRREKKREREARPVPEAAPVLREPPIRTQARIPAPPPRPALAERAVVKLPEPVTVPAAAATVGRAAVGTRAISPEISAITHVPEPVEPPAPLSPRHAAERPTLPDAWAFGPARRSHRTERRAGRMAGRR